MFALASLRWIECCPLFLVVLSGLPTSWPQFLGLVASCETACLQGPDVPSPGLPDT